MRRLYVYDAGALALFSAGTRRVQRPAGRNLLRFETQPVPPHLADVLRARASSVVSALLPALVVWPTTERAVKPYTNQSGARATV